MKSLEELVDEAQALEGAGRACDALKVLEAAVTSYPSSFAFCRLGWLASRLGRANESEEAFRRALKIGDDSGPPLIGLGSLALDGGDFEIAASYLNRALEIEPTAYGFCLLGVSLASVGKDQQAEDAYVAAIKIDPSREESHYNLGVLLRDVRPAEAQRHLEKALELDPDYSAAHRELGFLFSRQKRGPIAEYHLRRAIEIEPKDSWAHTYLGAYLEKAGDLSSAAREYELASQFAPSRAFPVWALGDLQEGRGKLDVAQALYEKALNLEPDSIAANKSLGRLLMKRGQSELAKEYFDRVAFLEAE